MVDREKVIKGLEHCIGDNCSGDKWYECEYSGHGCIDALLEDAIALLKAQEPETSDAPKSDNNVGCWYDITHNYTLEQVVSALKAHEPRVMTLEEIREGEVCWFDCPGNFILRPVICNMYDRGDSSYLNFIWQHGNFSWKICEYGRTWRCWTSRPDEKRRAETSWE